MTGYDKMVSTPMTRNMALQARVVAAKMNISRAELIRRAVADYLKKVSLSE